jgi:uncharacterized SAM-binding protein YcdF (DUF218 family)
MRSDRRLVVCLLGSQNDEQGQLSSEGVARAQVAMALWKCVPDSELVLTGGFGSHFNRSGTPHWQIAREYLLERGVPGGSIRGGVESGYTLDDFVKLNGSNLLQAGDTVAFVTSDYHVARASLLAHRLVAVEHFFVPAPTAPQPVEYTFRESEIEKLRHLLTGEQRA